VLYHSGATGIDISDYLAGVARLAVNWLKRPICVASLAALLGKDFSDFFERAQV
jgi:hypothetical protein